MSNLGTAPLPREPYAGRLSLPEFTLTSTDIQDGGTAPHGCAPPFSAWRAVRTVPRSCPGAVSPRAPSPFVLTCFDPDAPVPSGFWHWTVSTIPANVTSIDTGADAPAGALTHRNDAGVAGLLGAALRLVTARTATFSASPPWMWRSSTLTRTPAPQS